MNGEVAFISIEDGKRHISEIIKVKSKRMVYLQVFEDTRWVGIVLCLEKLVLGKEMPGWGNWLFVGFND